MDTRYPIGEFTWNGPDTSEQRKEFIDNIASAPQKLRAAVAGLNETQLGTPYRDGGWTVRQVVHHLPDSHINSYIRFKFALTEHEPTIKPYDEAVWAELIDAKTAPIEHSLSLLEGLHYRWTLLLRSLTDEHVKRRFNHPELGTVTNRQVHRTLCLARKASRCSHHVVARTQRLVGDLGRGHRVLVLT
jgi:hypothetical protein